VALGRARRLEVRIMRKTYRIANWRDWDKRVDACVRDFQAEFGRAPNLLAASPVMLRRINLAANRAHVGKRSGKSADPAAYVELRGFVGTSYSLLFIEETDVPEGSFSLVYAYASDADMDRAASL
jgi:hypothetical protein